MHDDSVGPVLPILPCIETDASQDLRVAPHNITMVPGEAVLTEVQGAPIRTTRPHTRPQGVEQNIYDTYRSAFL